MSFSSSNHKRFCFLADSLLPFTLQLIFGVDSLETRPLLARPENLGKSRVNERNEVHVLNVSEATHKNNDS